MKNTVRDLIEKLKALPEDILDKEVLQEGCDCYQRWSGEIKVMKDEILLTRCSHIRNNG